MVDPINRKLSSKAVEKEYLLDFINKELVPVVERLRLAFATLLGQVQSGEGSPEGVVTASVGSIYQRTDGGAGTSLYVKESGTGNTGWVGK